MILLQPNLNREIPKKGSLRSMVENIIVLATKVLKCSLLNLNHSTHDSHKKIEKEHQLSKKVQQSTKGSLQVHRFTVNRHFFCFSC